MNNSALAVVPEEPAQGQLIPFKEKEKAKLERIGDRVVSVRGFRMDFFEEHVEDHRFMPESKQWCDPDCMAKVIFGKTSKKNRVEIRKRLSRAFREMLKRGKFLAVEFASRGNGHHGEAIGFRFVLPGESGVAFQSGIARLNRMQRHLHMTQEEFEIAKKLLGLDGA